MIIQPEKGTRNVNDLFYESEKKWIDMLNREFFHNIELTKKENGFYIYVKLHTNNSYIRVFHLENI